MTAKLKAPGLKEKIAAYEGLLHAIAIESLDGHATNNKVLKNLLFDVVKWSAAHANDGAPQEVKDQRIINVFHNNIQKYTNL